MVGFRIQEDGRFRQHARFKEVAKANLHLNKTRLFLAVAKGIKTWEDDHRGAGVVLQP
jgi:hypothetical protein